MSTSNRQLIYIADPMCSWCWGFEPVIEKLVGALNGRAEFVMVTGGLRSETGPVPEQRRAMYREIWPRITEQTGQVFDCDLVNSDDFVYDTEPSCRAVVTVRTMAGDVEALHMFGKLQQAFYVESQDITQSECCTKIAGALGLDVVEFAERFARDEIKAMTQRDFQRGRELGASGFPTVLLVDGQKGAVLTQGYQPVENLMGLLEGWLNQ